VGGRIGLNAVLIVIWMAAMWMIGPERIIGFKHIPVLMAFATSCHDRGSDRGQLRLESPLWLLTFTKVDCQWSLNC